MKAWQDLFTKINKERAPQGIYPGPFKISLAVGTIAAGNALLPASDKLDEFKRFCQESWFESLKLVDEVHKKQRTRGQ